MKKHLLLTIAIAFSFCHKAMACGGSPEWVGNMDFRIVAPYSDDEEAYRKSVMPETIAFWYNYFRGKVKQTDIVNFINYAQFRGLEQGEYDDQPMYKALKNDAPAMRYMRVCLRLQDILRESWRYDVDDVVSDAATMLEQLGTMPAEFDYRVALLRMRIAMAQCSFDDVMNVWKVKGKSCPNKALRNRMKGYYAGSLYGQGQISEAMEIYAQLGDQRSLDMCVSHFVGFEGIKELLSSANRNGKAYLYAMQDYANYYWSANHAQDASLDNRMEGYYAGSLYGQVQISEPIGIYAELGDQRSLDMCVSDSVGSEGIKELLSSTDCNGQAYLYAMQDYANYYGSDNHAEDASLDTQNDVDDVDASVKNDGQRVKELCAQMVQEKRNDRIVWMSLLAWLTMTDGDNASALQMAEKAYKEKGTALQKDNAERIAMLARVRKACEENNKQACEQIVKDFSRLVERSKNELKAEHARNLYCGDMRTTCPYYTFLMSTYQPQLCAYLMKQRMLQGYLLQAYIVEKIEYGTPARDISWFRYLDEQATVEEAVSLLESLKKKKSTDAFGQQLIKNVDFNESQLCDVIGTKYIREGKYGLALSYFNQLSKSYVSSTAYQYYLSSRYRKPDVPFVRSRKTVNNDQTECDDVNYKAEFCQEMVGRINQLNTLTGDAKAQAEIDMAQRLFQASNMGDLWALSEFQWASQSTPNKLCNQSLAQLANAVKDAQTDKTRFDAYYGFALVPTQGEPFWSLHYDWKTRQENYTFLRSHPARAAYDYLANHRQINDLTKTCDVLRWYIKRDGK